MRPWDGLKLYILLNAAGIDTEPRRFSMSRFCHSSEYLPTSAPNPIALPLRAWNAPSPAPCISWVVVDHSITDTPPYEPPADSNWSWGSQVYPRMLLFVPPAYEARLEDVHFEIPSSQDVITHRLCTGVVHGQISSNRYDCLSRWTMYLGDWIRSETVQFFDQHTFKTLFFSRPHLAFKSADPACLCYI